MSSPCGGSFIQKQKPETPPDLPKGEEPCSPPWEGLGEVPRFFIVFVFMKVKFIVKEYR